MGKQKQRRHQKNKNNRYKSPTDNPKDNYYGNDHHNKQQSIIQRLRNNTTTNPEICETTLSALCMTIFHPNSLQYSPTENKSMKLISADLLHTILDKIVVDNDSTTSSSKAKTRSTTGIIVNALGCIQNIVSFDTNNNIIKMLLEGNLDVIRVLLVRISKSISILNEKIKKEDDNVTATATSVVVDMDVSSTTTTTSTTSPHKKKKKKNGQQHQTTTTSTLLDKEKEINQQWNILKLSYICLVTLMESSYLDNTQMIDKLTNPTYYQPYTLLHILKESILLVQSQVTTEDGSSTLAIMKDCIRYVAQILHSSIDENIPLTLQLVQDNDYSCIIDFLVNVMDSSTPSYYPAMAQLHVCGCILTLRQNLLIQDDITLAKITTQLTQLSETKVMQSLLHHLQSFNSQKVTSDYLEHIFELQEKLNAEKEDELLERQTIQTSDKKKESARSIAKRLSSSKKEKEKEQEEILLRQIEDKPIITPEEEVVESCNMETDIVSDNTPTDNNNEEELPEQNVLTLQEQYDEIKSNYKNYMSKYELTLEICTNLCCTQQQKVDYMLICNDDDEVEEKIDPILTQVFNIGIPNAIINLFSTLCSLTTNKNEETTTLLETCTSNIHNLYQNHFYIQQQLLQPLQVQLQWNNWLDLLQQHTTDTGVQGFIISILSILLRTCKEYNILPSEYTKQHVESFTNVFQQLTSSNNNNTKTGIDIIIILGIFLSPPLKQSTKVIQHIVQTIFIPILKTTSNNNKLSMEVMNVCMDIFSTEDYDEILLLMEGENTSGCLLHTLKEFWKKHKNENVGDDEEEIEYYSEIMENVVRFLEFKEFV